MSAMTWQQGQAEQELTHLNCQGFIVHKARGGLDEADPLSDVYLVRREGLLSQKGAMEDAERREWEHTRQHSIQP